MTDSFTVADAIHVGPETQGTRDVRLFNDVVAQVRLGSRFRIAAEVWGGREQRPAARSSMFYAVGAWGRASITDKTFVALRGEAIFDSDGVVTGQGARPAALDTSGQRLFGGTLTLGWMPTPNLVARLEAVHRISTEPYFAGGASDAQSDARRQTTSAIASLAMAF